MNQLLIKLSSEQRHLLHKQIKGNEALTSALNRLYLRNTHICEDNSNWVSIKNEEKATFIQLITAVAARVDRETSAGWHQVLAAFDLSEPGDVEGPLGTITVANFDPSRPRGDQVRDLEGVANDGDENKDSLLERIAKLEQRLAELEEREAHGPVQNGGRT